MYERDNRMIRGLGWTPTAGYLITLLGGLLSTSVGCSEQKVSPPATESVTSGRVTLAPADGHPGGKNPAPNDPAATAPASAAAAKNPNAARPESSGAIEPSEATSGSRVKIAAPTAVADLPAAPASLQVKRFVVTSSITAREPAAVGATLTLGKPIYAFAELASGAGAPASVELVFEDATGRKVGHVNLDVPANQPRWRTWGQSRYVNEPGPWTAILLDSERAELARAAFEVSAAEVSAPEVSDVPAKDTPKVVAQQIP